MPLPGNFWAAAIGSLPYQEPGPALELIFKNMPLVPHWPQLPRRGHQEHFVYQSLSPLVRLGLIKDEPGEMPVFTDASPDWAANLTAFYSLYLEAEAGSEEALAAFAIPREAGIGFYALVECLEQHGPGRARFLKGQVAGPVTAGLYLSSSSGRSAFYDPQLRDLIVKTTAMQACWQVRELGRFGLPVLVFVDDPALAAYGTSTHVALQRDDLVEALAGVVEGIRAKGGLPGAHSCSGVEWPIFFESGYQIVSFDAYNYFTSLQVFAPDVATFLDRDGVLAWGIVPTYEQAWQETAASLAVRLQGAIEELTRKGVDRELLYHQSLVTPACGTGVLDVRLAEHIYKLTAGVAELMGQEL
ncbi:hypothetical protein E308F_31050 [Moorella sp. E308F]|uniref:hypothetical protein n=1 Tax=unclassified Neomoorella TaxID=2676739 RepID=UPI0010FFAD4F|nr:MULTISPECIES: hypothetical protein [unclassified Moorella (in: firmicutes)]GEA16859.1 hypothetical protein E308F_31050 [Moorella sp. E308F]GEA17090.1 hypothetical protein E306M_02240 [Moorella sp. E306M]